MISSCKKDSRPWNFDDVLVDVRSRSQLSSDDDIDPFVLVDSELTLVTS